MKKSLLTFVMMLVAVTMSLAQVTTSGISGKVTDAMGSVIGATVQAIHTPSGTIYGTTSNAEGRYTISGMRAGGPYTIKVSYVGMDTRVVDNVSLQLGETFRYNCRLEESAAMLQEAVVTSNAIDASKTGAAMHMSAAAIEQLPSINHNIADIARMSPQVRVTEGGAMFFAGTNNRYNSFQIDGAMNNDVFGLTSNGSNGGQAGTNPVSLETIDQIQINVAPFDVRQGGFTGGSINAITKSGTNEVHGSAYGYFQNQNFIGKKYTMRNGKDSEELANQEDYTYGITLGGPIIKDKLFFFVNYEKTDKSYDNAYGPGAAASKVDGALAQSILNKVKEMAAEQGVTYNGTLGTPNEYTKSQKAGVKLDWNINEKHHASFRWSLVDAKQLNQASGSTSLNANTYAYDFTSKTNSFVAELQSRFNEEFSNEFHASYTQVRDSREPGQAFPMISISNVGNGTLNLGNERSSMANGLDQDIYTFTDNFTWFKGNHTLTFGTHNEFYKFSNLFIQDAYGTYYFNNVDDFMNGKINRFRFGQANVDVTGNPRWAAEFAAGQLGFYAQDKWNVTDNFDLTYGVRIDMPLFFDTPAENEDFNSYAAENNWDYKTNRKLSSTPMWSPRIGFRWNMDDDTKMILRGGVGIFTGRVPFVWLSNSFSNTGIQTVSYSTYSTDNIDFILDPKKQATNLPASSAGAPSRSAQTINVFDKDFKFAQSLRVNLAYDFQAAGIDWTLEGIYAKTLNDVMIDNLNIEDAGKTLAETYAGLDFDQRPTYKKGEYSGIYALRNTDGGYSYNLSVKGEKHFNFGLDLMASYTYTQSKTVNNGTSSVAASNWQYNYTHKNPNDPELTNSSFNVPNAIMASAYYHYNWGRNRRNNSDVTTIGLIYSANSGSPYTIYYNGDLNGDNGYNDLMFIPTQEQIQSMLDNGRFKATTAYSAADQAKNMNAWIDGDDYLSEHRGEYFDRYADNEDFEHRFDFHLDHKHGIMIGNSMRYIQLSFDIMNVGNMLNKEWGRTLGSGYNYYSPVTVSKGQYQFLHDADYDMRSYADFYSRWRGQLGLKLIF